MAIEKEIIKSFFLCLKRLSLYSSDHPLSRDVLNHLFKIISGFLKEKKEMLLVAGSNSDEMIVDQEVVSGDNLGAREVYEKFKVLKLEGIQFAQGLTYGELVDFVKVVAGASVLDGGKVLPIPELLQKGSEHIRIKKVHYEKVEDGEAVVMRPDAGPGPEVSSGSIKKFLSGSHRAMGEEDVLSLDELDQGDDAVVRALTESIKESGDPEIVIKRLVEWLSKNIIPVVLKKKRDPAGFIQKFLGSLGGSDLAVLSPSAGAAIEKAQDEVKTAVIVEALVLYGKSSRKAVALAAKILTEEDDCRRLASSLAEQLKGRGVLEDDITGFMQKLDRELAQDEEVSVSKKKLQKLMRMSERFEEELDKKVKAATGELVRLNKRLADEKERSEGVMRHLADGLVVVDKAGKIIMMNPAAEKLLGCDMQDSIGKSFMDGLKEEHVAAVVRGPLSDESMTKEIEVCGSNETTKRVLRASSAVVENEDGKTVGMVSVLSDITRQKEVEAMKSHFVSLVTHELRTPVVAIQKSLELILNKTTGAINEDQERFLSISKFNLQRLNRLINDLLDMSQLEAGKMHLKPETFDFRDLVREVKALLHSWAAGKEIAIQLELTDHPIEVVADRDRMSQVLMNLIGNALKFTRSGGEVKVTLRSLEAHEALCPGPCLEVTVADNGIGIDLKDCQRIFDKFEQVSLVEPTGTTGSGLGLPIAREIVHLHGGKIWVESQKGQGSRFIFVIPRGHKS